jgi:PIN domain nuclease of toxin-antitoxin system
MADEYVIDAHALIWYVEDSPRLGVNAGKILDDPASALYLPVIALAEACWIMERGRCNVSSVADLLADVDADPRITLVSLDRLLLDLTVTLTAIGEMHDRQIVATALHRASTGASVSLLTCDSNIVSSGLVSIVW